jgi:2-oxoglutarate ferredoxin oxidoreductase subunit beta
MTFIAKPKVVHPSLPRNARGLIRRDYEGALSTLCAGCGHDSITAAIVEAAWRQSIEPQNLVKLSGIGCSSKTTAYFVSGAHGFNSVHGRMPSIATGANAANRRLTYIGVSGDGDTLSIGLGQFCHAIRRNLDMLYIIENNGVYGLTKGQFSASADIGSKAKKGETNAQPPIDPVLLAMTLGASFVARSFSGDKQQLVPLIEAGLRHRGFALIDVLSPCVTFNDHEGSTKSYAYTREHYEPAVQADFVPPEQEITAEYRAGEALAVTMHDGSRIVLRKLDEGYDPTDRSAAQARVQERLRSGEYLTGLLYVGREGVADGARAEFHEVNGTVEEPLNSLPYEVLSPGSKGLTKLLARYR